MTNKVKIIVEYDCDSRSALIAINGREPVLYEDVDFSMRKILAQESSGGLVQRAPVGRCISLLAVRGEP